LGGEEFPAGVEEVVAMGVGGLEVGADCDEAGGALGGLEGPGDLVVDLDHAQGAFGVVVREWHPGVVEKARYLGFADAEAGGEVERFALGVVPAAAVTAAGWPAGGEEREGDVEGGVVVGSDLGGDVGGHDGEAFVGCCGGRVPGGAEDPCQLLGPQLEGDRLADVVEVAEEVGIMEKFA
jgi:hypothetical protein